MAANHNKKNLCAAKIKVNQFHPTHAGLLYVKHSDTNYYITMRNNAETKKQ